MAISGGRIDMKNIVQERNWVNWGMLVNQDDILTMAGGFRPGKVEEIGVLVPNRFLETGAYRKGHV